MSVKPTRIRIIAFTKWIKNIFLKSINASKTKKKIK